MEEEKNYDIKNDLENYEIETEEERERRLRRKKRIEEMQREKRRAQLRQKCVIPGAIIAAAVLSVSIAVSASHKQPETPEAESTSVEMLAAESGAAADGGKAASNGGTLDGGEPASEANGGTLDGSEPTSAANGGTLDGGEPTSEANGGSLDGGEPASAANGGTLDGGEPASAANGGTLDGSQGTLAAGTGAGTEVYGPFPTESPKEPVFSAESTASTNGFGDEIVSQYGILIDVESKEILAQREAKTRMNPASMTKILTVLTAADALGLTGEDWEQKEVLDDTFAITIEITDYSYVNDCSNVGFEVGEEVTVRDLFYGTVLPSGGDAALGLACYVAGSQEAFVELMNQKLEELGLSETSHFVNCVGLYDADHYSTVYDMAVMLQTAADSDFCRQVLSAHTYTTSQTVQHPEGLLISNWFLRRIEDRDTHGEVICGKTGYVVQSGSCAASLAADGAGREYLCVTAASSSSWQCIYDQVELYQKYLAAEEQSP